MFYIFAESLLNSGNVTLVFSITFVYWEGFFLGVEWRALKFRRIKNTGNSLFYKIYNVQDTIVHVTCF